MKNKLCYLLAIKLLTKKDYSIHKLKTKLLSKEFQTEEVDEVIELLIEKKFLKENLFIEGRIISMMKRGYSPAYIQKKLNDEKCYPDLHVINEIYLSHGQSEDNQVRDLIEKRWRSAQLDELDEARLKKEKDKLTRFVISKGFEYSLARREIESYLQTHRE